MTVDSLVPLFTQYYMLHKSWGAIHAAFSDENWCSPGDMYFRNYARDHLDLLGMAVGGVIAQLSEDEQKRLRDAAEEMADELSVFWTVGGSYC